MPVYGEGPEKRAISVPKSDLISDLLKAFFGNDKLAELEITAVICVDGMSNYIPAISPMPKQNCITIHEEIYSGFAKNLVHEVNKRVGYPLKYALLQLEELTELSRTDYFHLFSCSYIGGAVYHAGLAQFISDWNQHPVSGAGVPSHYVSGRRNLRLPPGALVSTERAVEMYEAAGGSLSRPSPYGQDILNQFPDLIAQRHQLYWPLIISRYGPVKIIFELTVCHDYRPLQDAIMTFIRLSKSLVLPPNMNPQ